MKLFLLILQVSLLTVLLSSMYGTDTTAKTTSTKPTNAKPNQADYIVKKGETIEDIAVQFGVSITELKNINEKSSVKKGDQLILPKSISEEDKELLSRLVHAEAKGEPYEGKVAVASVVLNRVASSQFPDTIKEVIYQDNQFEPVANGSIEQAADDESIKAVNEALAYQGQKNNLLYFFNPKTSTSKWIRKLTVVETIGNHCFA